ncbi:unnamed protein product [Moneuplotes crassus]|uniref:Uncharacterized protein n=1 Tax=Euplotes crassus TaxID=5936 RepID=A0AAD1XUC9_EUPCR|nr:unnamed protein product [Moneuplotes crassus]
MELEPRVEKEKEVHKKTEQIQQSLYEVSFEHLFNQPATQLQYLRWDINFAMKRAYKVCMRKLETIGIRLCLSINIGQFQNRPNFSNFLKTSFIKKTSELRISLEQDKPKKFSFYQKSIMKFLPRVIGHLILKKCEINSNQFRKIIQIGRHIKYLAFSECKISLYNLKLSPSIHYSTVSIDFSGDTPILGESSKEQMIQDLKHFLNVASQTDLTDSLEYLHVPFNIRSCISPFIRDSALKGLHAKF